MTRRRLRLALKALTLVETAAGLGAEAAERLAERLRRIEDRASWGIVPVWLRERSPIGRAPKQACDPTCPGWCISESDSRGWNIERCDECWHGEEDPPYDEDFAATPECQEALRKFLEEEVSPFEPQVQKADGEESPEKATQKR